MDRERPPARSIAGMQFTYCRVAVTTSLAAESLRLLQYQGDLRGGTGSSANKEAVTRWISGYSSRGITCSGASRVVGIRSRTM